MVRFKVRPRRDALKLPCTPELQSLLACFATSSDLTSTQECAAAAKALQGCMSNRPRGGKAPKSSVVDLDGCATPDTALRDVRRLHGNTALIAQFTVYFQQINYLLSKVK